MRPRNPDPNLYRLNCPKRVRKPYLSGKQVTDVWLFIDTSSEAIILGQLAFQQTVRGWLCSGWVAREYGAVPILLGGTGNTAYPSQMKALSDALMGLFPLDHDLLEAMDQVAALEYLQHRWCGCMVMVGWSQSWPLAKGHL